MTEKYRYSTLADNNIRVLHIQPHLEDGFLQASLQSIPLKDAEDNFVAVSWTWGPESKAETHRHVKIDGQLSSVRPNLWEMLNTFRVQNKSLSLWIDAICIDQDKSKPQEKNIQIPMMADIYKSAREVYVWLGPPADDSDYVMQTLSSNAEDLYTSSRFVSGLLKILERPWWTRTWIVQEYVLNKRSPIVFCGLTQGVSVELILEVWTNERTRNAVAEMNPGWSPLQKLGTIYWLRALRDSRYNPSGVHLERNLRNALLWLKGFEATEPRDKIYGALGLIEAKHREEFVKKVGVHTSKATANVYLDATVYLLECEKTSTIFHDFPLGGHHNPDIPSWTPNFNVDIASTNESIVRLGDVTSDHLDNPREEISISKDQSTMFVRGQLLDRVTKRIVVGDEAIPGWNRHDQFGNALRMPHLLHKIQSLLSQSAALSRFQQLSPEPLWKTLIAGCFGSLVPEDLKDEVRCQQCFDELMAIPLGNSLSFLQGVAERDLFTKLLSVSPDESEIQDYYMKVMQNLNRPPHILLKIQRTLSIGRVFFTGEDGHYGIGEAGTHEGDLIVLLFPDHFVPFILRERGEVYEMIGVAYLPDPIKNAAIAGIKSDRTRLQSFALM